MIEVTYMQAAIALVVVAILFFVIGTEINYRLMKSKCTGCGATYFDCGTYGRCCTECTHD